MKKRTKKRAILGIVLLLLFLFLLFLLVFPALTKLQKPSLKSFYSTRNTADVSKPLRFGGVSSFEEAYDGIKMIDDKYNLNFRKEALFGLMVKEEYIPYIKTDLDNLRKKLDPAGTVNSEDFFNLTPIDRTEKQLSLIFIDTRRKMIESQEEFHKGYSSGVQGLVGDGFYCREEPVITESIQAFNRSAQHAADAKYFFDELLTDSAEITWDLVGVEDEKPVFYYSPVESMWAQLQVNRRILEEYCHDKRRFGGKPIEKIFVSFDQSKHADVFVSPRKVIVPKMWNILTEPVQASTLRIAGTTKLKTDENR